MFEKPLETALFLQVRSQLMHFCQRKMNGLSIWNESYRCSPLVRNRCNNATVIGTYKEQLRSGNHRVMTSLIDPAHIAQEKQGPAVCMI